jgi:hypothetical protein
MPEGFDPFDSLTASSEEISQVEEALGVGLPDSYKEFLRVVGAGSFLFLDLLPAVRQGDVDEDLVSVNTGNFKIPDFVAVAPVGTGDWWGFPVVDGRCEDRVLFWDHETGELQAESNGFLEFVAAKGLSTGR